VLEIDAPTVDRTMTWSALVEALRRGHLRPKPVLDDMYLGVAGDGMLVRAAVVDGLGSCVKAVRVVAANSARVPPLPTIHGQVLVFDGETGVVTASIDGAAVTRWKTAGDSALGADLLARADAETFLMVGAGTMAEPLVRAHCAARPSLSRVLIWNRGRQRAEALLPRLADLQRKVDVVDDLDAAVRSADVISVATMSHDPIIRGRLLKPGAHLDLVGAYTLEMREADDDAMRRGLLFVDYRGTTIGHIGEVTTPIRSGVIKETDILGDFYDLVSGSARRTSSTDITVFKNGGGAHLDLMTSRAIIDQVAG
jgi:ornithine cyclodeaminase